MIQISKDDAAFILDELNNRAQHQINAYGAVADDLQSVINDLEAQLGLDAEVPTEAPAEEAPAEQEPEVAQAPADTSTDDTAPASTTPAE